MELLSFIESCQAHAVIGDEACEQTRRLLALALSPTRCLLPDGSKLSPVTGRDAVNLVNDMFIINPLAISVNGFLPARRYASLSFSRVIHARM